MKDDKKYETLNINYLKIFKFFYATEKIEDLVASIKYLNLKPNFLNQTSIYRLNTLKEFEELHNWFQSCLDTVFDALKLPDYFKKIILTESWGNVSYKNQSHHSHHHPNSFMSAIFYLNSDSNIGNTIFMPKNDWLYDFPLCEAFKSGFNQDLLYNYFEEKPETGKLLIFPSALRHSVGQNLSESTRYTISFNSYPEFYYPIDSVFLSIKVEPYKDMKKINFLKF